MIEENQDAGKDRATEALHGPVLREPVQGEEEVPPEEGRARVHAQGEVVQGAGEPEQAQRPVRVVPSPITGFPPPIEHRWKPGQSGNPSGRPKPLSGAIAGLIDREAAAIVRALVSQAKNGDVRAAELLFERVEGAVPKDVNHTGALGVIKVLLRKDVHG
jgi:hypothetical protein